MYHSWSANRKEWKALYINVYVLWSGQSNNEAYMISKWQRDVDFEDFTETEQSRFCIQRINKIGKLQDIETVATNKFATKPTVSNAQAINQAFKFPIALNNSSSSHRLFC